MLYLGFKDSRGLGFKGKTNFCHNSSNKIKINISSFCFPKILHHFFDGQRNDVKKGRPLTGPVKRNPLVIDFFAVGVTNSSRFVGTQTCVAFKPPKKTSPSARSKWGPILLWSPLVTWQSPLILSGDYYKHRNKHV